MVQIAPFDAVRYNSIRFGNDVGRFVAPPYDSIDRGMERSLKKDRLNITHLTLGNEGDEYLTAGKRLRRWLNDEVLVRDGGRSLYLYEQTFQGTNGIVRVRTGIVAVVRIEDPSNGAILPHENTIPKHKADRMALMSALGGNSEQIFMLYDDKTGEVEEALDSCRKSAEILRFIDPEGVHHRIVRINDDAVISRIGSLLESERMLIADGHHRYETAVEYRNRRKGDSEQHRVEPSDYVLATLVSFRNPGLVINPTHRLVRNIDEKTLATFRNRLDEQFVIRDCQSPEELESALKGAPATAFGVWCPSNGLIALVEPKEANIPGPLGGLSVFVLQERVLKDILGFTTDMLDKKTNIEFIKDIGSARFELSSEERSMFFMVKAPTVDQVKEVAKEGLRMPHKSTYFYPKIWSGVLLYLFGEG
ncbi:MAG: DUF1015 domain-containing protein [Methanobacteriota archaeon]|nr:MAG: DUF1015 domain-containing protein [Euryarchaeota archaeon]